MRLNQQAPAPYPMPCMAVSKRVAALSQAIQGWVHFSTRASPMLVIRLLLREDECG